jgi:hypothetical protein
VSDKELEMPRVNWHETVLKGIFVQQIVANYALVVNGVTNIQPKNAMTNRMFIMNNSSEPVYLGADANVDATNGFPILPNDVVVFSFYTGSLSLYLYGNGQEIRILEVC